MTDSAVPLTTTIEQIGKMLNREVAQGYRDRAIRGGVTAYAQQALLPLRGSLPTREADDTVGDIVAHLRDYRRLDIGTRQLQLAAALAALRRLYVLVRKLEQNDPTAQPRYIGPPAKRRPKPPPAPAAPVARKAPPLTLAAPVTDIAGVGPAVARLLGLLNIRLVGDLLTMLPRDYQDYSQEFPIAHAFYGQEGTVKGVVQSLETHPLPQKAPGQKQRQMVVAEIADNTGSLTATWFNPYVAKALRPGMAVVLSGTIGQRRGHLVMEGPDYEPLNSALLNTGRIVPVYPLRQGIRQSMLRKYVAIALDACADHLVEFVPESVRERAHLLPLADATRAIHFPPDEETLHRAQYCLGFNEFFLLQLGMQRRKREWQQGAPGNSFVVDPAPLQQFLAALPFALTAAQRRVLSDIVADMRRPVAMSRLVQGDVGSGKTVVAAAAMLAAINEGYQTALMAPTAILAEQHARTLERLYAGLPEARRPVVRLLIGSTGAKERRAIAAGLEDGTINLLVGTQALIQAGVAFARLGLATVDEQHRFGVVQRATLRSKGHNPDLLVMTATPIPRSLALTLHGDLDVSVIDELPPGRQAIITRAVGPEGREREYEAIRAEVQAGRQAFVICPLVEESEQIEAKAATAEWERLRTEVFPDLRVALLHGRMRPAEKDQIMLDFRERAYDILVSTAVIEVGIDIPNATIMLIEGANRFGLSQLHQFRGRVGRGAAQSYCILVADEASRDAQSRLEAMVETQDGFVLAQKDLEMRGPGEFLGTRQSGLPELEVARLSDVRLLERARREAEAVLDADPTLEQPEHLALQERLRQFWKAGTGDIS